MNYIRIKEKLRAYFGKEFFSFLLHSKNYLTAELFNKLSALITIPVITRIILPEEYGFLSIYLTIVMLVGILLDLNFRSSVTRFYYDNEIDFKEYVGSGLLTVLVFGFFILVSLFYWSNQISDFLQIPQKLYILGVITAFLMIPISNYGPYLIARKDSIQYIKLITFLQSGTAYLSLPVIYLLIAEKYYGRVYVQIAISLILCIYILLKVKKRINWNWNKAYAASFLKFTLPLIFHSLAGIILVSFDQLIINQLEGPVATGNYAFAYQIGMILNLYITGANKSWTPIFYEYLNKKKYTQIRDLAKKYMFQTALFASLLLLFCDEIAFVFGREGYFDALDIIPLVVLSYIPAFWYHLYVQYASYKKKIVAIAVITVLAGTLNIILNYILIPEFGYKIAALTTFISYLFFFLGHFLNVKLRFKDLKPYSFWILLKSSWMIALVLVLKYIIDWINFEGWYTLVLKIVTAGILGIILLKKLNINR